MIVFYTDYYPVSDIGRGLGFRLKIRVSRQDYYVNTDLISLTIMVLANEVSLRCSHMEKDMKYQNKYKYVLLHQDNHNILNGNEATHRTSHHKFTYLERF